MDENDLAIAKLMERQILKETRPLGCGCVVKSKYGHPLHRDWFLVSNYEEPCAGHKKLADSFEKEKSQGWSSRTSSFLPKWRDENGLWLLWDEWEKANEFPSFTNKGEPISIPSPATFTHKGTTYLLLVGYLGTPVILGDNKSEKMRGRAICLDLVTGKTIPLKVDEEMLMRFGWEKKEA